MKTYYALGARYSQLALCMRERMLDLVREEKGDLVSSLGWMAILALVLVAIKGLVDGKLIGYVNAVFGHLDKVFNS